MKTVRRARDREELRRRLQTLDPSTPRVWGRMSAPQMVCHLADAFRMGLGQVKVTPARGWMPPTLLKWIALYLPMAWPSGIPTSPEIDQAGGCGTAPADFAADVARACDLIERVAGESHGLGAVQHPVFGRMSEAQWLRWAWLHTDHHLRQFGA